jgi:hypothetical protein
MPKCTLFGAHFVGKNITIFYGAKDYKSGIYCKEYKHYLDVIYIFFCVHHPYSPNLVFHAHLA